MKQPFEGIYLRVAVPVAVHTPTGYRFSFRRGPPIRALPAETPVGLTGFEPATT
jgi:hypothetical protein